MSESSVALAVTGVRPGVLGVCWGVGTGRMALSDAPEAIFLTATGSGVLCSSRLTSEMDPLVGVALPGSIGFTKVVREGVASSAVCPALLVWDEEAVPLRFLCLWEALRTRAPEGGRDGIGMVSEYSSSLASDTCLRHCCARRSRSEVRAFSSYDIYERQ